MAFPTELELEHNGFLPAVPRNLARLLPSTLTAPQPMTAAGELAAPTSELSERITALARDALPTPVFNHSMRVYHFALAIARQHLPAVAAALAPDALLAAALLHDLGTAPGAADSPLSFEYAGGLRARELLLQCSAAPVLADSVCEAVIRHQDVFVPGVTGGIGRQEGGQAGPASGADGQGADGQGEEGQGQGQGEEADGGRITALTALIHFGTLLDNTGQWEQLVHPGTVDDVVTVWPRLRWSACFCAVLQGEGERKPWCHTSSLGVARFQAAVRANQPMKAYEA